MTTVTNEVQKMGSAFGLWTASREFLHHLTSVRHHFEENAIKLYPHLSKHSTTRNKRKSKTGLRDRDLSPHPEPEPKSAQLILSEALVQLSEAVDKYLVHMDDFPDFTDVYGRAALTDFSALTRVSPCISSYCQKIFTLS